MSSILRHSAGENAQLIWPAFLFMCTSVSYEMMPYSIVVNDTVEKMAMKYQQPDLAALRRRFRMLITGTYHICVPHIQCNIIINQNTIGFTYSMTDSFTSGLQIVLLIVLHVCVELTS